MIDTETEFDQHFAGVWKRRWYGSLVYLGCPSLIEVCSYTTGEISGRIIKVHAESDDGRRITFEIGKGSKTLSGYRRVRSTGPE